MGGFKTDGPNCCCVRSSKKSFSFFDTFFLFRRMRKKEEMMMTMTMASLSLMATSQRMKVLRKRRYDFWWFYIRMSQYEGCMSLNMGANFAGERRPREAQTAAET